MNDFDYMEQSDNQFNMGQFSVSNDEATLILCSPRQINDLCTRPLMYNFSNQLIEDISTNIDKRSSGHGSETLWTPNMMTAVLPEGNGQRVDTLNLSNSWTFVLIINMTPKGISYGATGPTKRFIASGVCLSEPINPMTMYMSTPTINEFCVLQIHHSTTLSLCPTMNNHYSGYTKRLDTDFDSITQQTGQYYKDPMYIMNNKKLRETTNFDGDTQVFRSGEAAIGNNEHSVNIQTSEGSPKHELNRTIDTISRAVNMEKTQNGIENYLIGNNRINTYNNFINNIDAEMMNDGILNSVKLGLDISVPQILGDVIKVYPSIKILPFNINNTGSGLGERPQTLLGNQNTMSSLIVNCMNTIIPHAGLSEVMFRYDSFNHNVMQIPGRTSGTWELQHACELISGNEMSLESSLSQFKMLMESDVFPILLTTCGDFSLTCKYDITGETIINLQFLDEAQIDGYYVHHNKLGGLVSPHIGTINNLHHNSGELCGLFKGISTNVLGASTNSMIDSAMYDTNDNSNQKRYEIDFSSF